MTAGMGTGMPTSTVTVTRVHHPLAGKTLRVLGRMRRHGRLELLLELSDGSKRLIPAEWTSQDGGLGLAVLAGPFRRDQPLAAIG